VSKEQRLARSYFTNELSGAVADRARPGAPVPPLPHKVAQLIVSLSGKDAFAATPASIVQAPRGPARLIQIPRTWPAPAQRLRLPVER